MFGFFLDKKNIFSISFLFFSFVFAYSYLNYFLNIGLTSFLFISLVSLIHLIYFNFYIQPNNNTLYLNYLFFMGLLFSLNPNLSIKDLSVIFCFGILWFLLGKGNFKTLEFQYTIGLFSGFILISDWSFSVIVLSIFFLINFWIFNLARLINFILGFFTAFCLFWTMLFVSGDTEILTQFFYFDFRIVELKKELLFFIIKLLFLLPVVLIMIYVMNYFIERQVLFLYVEIKRINFMISMALAIFIGILFTGKHQYFLFLLNFPITYLIGFYLNYSISEKKHSLIKEAVLTMVTLSYFIYFVFENNLFFW